MAARRLVIVMLVLLGVSSLAAALVPVAERDGEESDPSSTAAEADRAPAGRLLERTLRAEPGERPTIRMRVGDQLALTVAARRPDQVEIVGLGELDDVDRLVPAVFDLAPFEAGSYPVKLLGAERVIGRIEVVAPRPSKKEQKPGGRSGGEAGRASESPRRA